MQVLPYILNFSRQFPEEVLILAFINIRHFPRRVAVKFVASGIKWRKTSGNEVTSLGLSESRRLSSLFCGVILLLLRNRSVIYSILGI